MKEISRLTFKKYEKGTDRGKHMMIEKQLLPQREAFFIHLRYTLDLESDIMPGCGAIGTGDAHPVAKVSVAAQFFKCRGQTRHIVFRDQQTGLSMLHDHGNIAVRCTAHCNAGCLCLNHGHGRATFIIAIRRPDARRN
jgi:hypothetical protein